MPEKQNPIVLPSSPTFHAVNPGLLAMTLSVASEGDKDRNKTEGDPESRGGKPVPDITQEKTIAEAFDDLDAEDKQTAKRLLDRMIGRKP